MQQHILRLLLFFLDSLVNSSTFPGFPDFPGEWPPWEGVIHCAAGVSLDRPDKWLSRLTRWGILTVNGRRCDARPDRQDDVEYSEPERHEGHEVVELIRTIHDETKNDHEQVETNQHLPPTYRTVYLTSANIYPQHTRQYFRRQPTPNLNTPEMYRHWIRIFDWPWKCQAWQVT